jgi:enediyne biosynthesis protein E4
MLFMAIWSGDGRGNFTDVPPLKSGLNLRGNVRSLQPIETKAGATIIAGVNNDHAMLLNVK